MALEVVGSNPTIYQIKNQLHVKLFKNNNTLKISSSYYLIYVLYYLYIKHIHIPYSFNLNNVWYFSNLKLFDNNPFFRKISKTPFISTYKNYTINFKNSIYLKKSFLTYIKLNISTQNLTLKPHHSFKSFFIQGTFNGSMLVLSVNKFYNKYTNVLQLVSNLFYYNFLL